MNLFGGKRKKELNLVLDIASGSIGGAFILKEAGKIPIILHTTRKAFRLQENSYTERMKKEMLETLDSVCLDLQKEVELRPDRIFCVLSTPWSHGELRSISYERKTDFRFTEKHAQKLVGEEVEKFKKEWSNLREVIDKRVTRVTLNGYTVAFPHGQKTRSLRLDVFLSLSPKDFITHIEEKIHKTFKAKIALTSQMFSDFIVVRDIFEIQNDFLVINVGGEVTEVMLMKDDMLAGTGFFPLGQGSFIRLIASKLNKGIYETKSLISLFKSGHFDDASNEKLSEIINGVMASWFEQLKMVISTLEKTRHIPHNIFLSGETEGDPFIGKSLNKRNLPEFTTSLPNFNVILGSNKVLHNFCDFAPKAERDAGLTMKTIFINHL